MLTAEQVRDAVMSADRWEKPMGDTGLTNTHLIIRDDGWQAIADELNAELGSGTCEPNWVLQGKTQTQEFWRCECGNCGESFGVEDRSTFPFKMTIDEVDVPNFCPECGAKQKAVER